MNSSDLGIALILTGVLLVTGVREMIAKRYGTGAVVLVIPIAFWIVRIAQSNGWVQW